MERWVLAHLFSEVDIMSAMCYRQSMVESTTSLSHLRHLRLSCHFRHFFSEISRHWLILYSPLFSLSPFFVFFQALFDFASLRLLYHCANVSLFLLNLSLCFLPHPTPASPSMGHSLHRSRISLRPDSEKGSNSATFPLVKLGGAIKQPRGLVGSQMVSAELSFC